MRGRLLNVFLAELAQLDTVATETGPPGYDAVFREPRVTYDPSGARTVGRKEATPVRFRCQVETNTFETQRMTGLGNAPASLVTLVLHRRDLERAGLVDAATGRTTLRVNDRLVAIYNLAGAVETTFPNPPGLFCSEVTPSGYGFGGRVNLLVMKFGDRPQARIS